MAFLILDATYLKVRHSEAETHWRSFLQSLRERGIGIPDLVTSEAHEGLRAALRANLNATPWQRCQFHLQQNAQSHVPKVSMRKEVAAEIRRIFNADSALRLVTAVLMDISEDWETGNAYLSIAKSTLQ